MKILYVKTIGSAAFFLKERIKKFIHTGVAAAYAYLTGSVSIGKSVPVISGATVLNHLTISDPAVIGADGVAIGNITENGICVEVPVRRK